MILGGLTPLTPPMTRAWKWFVHTGEHIWHMNTYESASLAWNLPPQISGRRRRQTQGRVPCDVFALFVCLELLQKGALPRNHGSFPKLRNFTGESDFHWRGTGINNFETKPWGDVVFFETYLGTPRRSKSSPDNKQRPGIAWLRWSGSFKTGGDLPQTHYFLRFSV